MSSEVEEQKKIQEKILEIESMAKKFMTQEAIERYGRLKSAHQQKALQAMVLIAHLGSQNQIKEKITDEQFKDILMRLEPEKRETKIIRK
ncbi:hypothetical protein J4230_05365 [Candidatus Woesearchaeota archaeon]|nr:hypothetical protein [Candidatus Woesearchaeota archaeon]